MAKLHELLAVEGDLEGIRKKIMQETQKTFGKEGLFYGFSRSLEMFEESGQSENKVEEHQELTTTVGDKLDYMSKSVIRLLDAVLQKESTNQGARADLIVDGITIAEQVPATFLLGLETKLKDLRTVYNDILTLPPGVEWVKDETKGKDIYSRSRPEEVLKTEKRPQHKVLVPPTFPKSGESGQALPAQIEKWNETVNVGKYVKHVWSGMLTPTQKSSMLGRIDKLIRETKKARMRANSTDVVKRTIGKEIFNYINK